MLQKIQDLTGEIENFQITDSYALENFRLAFLSKKGALSVLFEDFKQVPNQEKKEVGQRLNVLKQLAENKFKEAQQVFESGTSVSEIKEDLTLPLTPHKLGTRHPISIIQERVISIFRKIGFNISYGPEIEDDYHNFTALNFPENHPAREMQDTFFIKRNPDILLRTHTSNIQTRVLKKGILPVRTLAPGRVYRNEAISARAHCFFHQIEGFYVNENVSFSDLKQTLLYFAKEMFGSDAQIRLRPSFFPFTEPSVEVDVSCELCHGKGCNVCKYSGWVEILGAGMIDPHVLEACDIDPQKYSGFAFGMGVERITMLKFQIKDLRLFSENDVRFLRQFTVLN